MRKEPRWHKVVKWGFFFVMVVAFFNLSNKTRESHQEIKKVIIVDRPDDGLFTKVKLQVAFYQLELCTISFVWNENPLSYEDTKQRPHTVLDLKS